MNKKRQNVESQYESSLNEIAQIIACVVARCIDKDGAEKWLCGYGTTLISQEITEVEICEINRLASERVATVSA